MGLTQTVAPTGGGPPAGEPVTLVEAKSHLRVTETVDDTDITSIISRARQWCEDYCNRQFITATWKQTFDGFAEACAGRKYFELARPPLQSVTSIKYLDTSGVEQTLATTVYNVITDTEVGIVELAYGQSWPSIRNQIGAVRVVFVAGYGAAAALPPGGKAAVLLMIENLYRFRGDVVTAFSKKLELTAEALLDLSLGRVRRVS